MRLLLALPFALAQSLGQVLPVAVHRDGAPDFPTEVRPILARRCFPCHGNDEATRGAGLRLDSFQAATHLGEGGAAIVPGDPDESELLYRVNDEFDPMPPEEAGERLTMDEVETLRHWIAAGAEYAPHWAFVAPRKPAMEGVDGQHPVDTLVAAQHVALGLDWAERADDYTLFRRLSLDLTGLPPDPEAARVFAQSEDVQKYGAAIDTFLASPDYAERWAAVWLDLARYADSSGHGSDPLRVIWRYRDWVIEAFDRNLPFDQFTVQQLAGDLLPSADVGTRLATAFHRNTMTNSEGGTDNEEFRVLAVKDRVNTTMSVWMGLTAGCAECHSHKYDPISHTEYYELFDIFNQTADADLNDDQPRLETPTAAQMEGWRDLSKEKQELAQQASEFFGDPSSAAHLGRQAALLARADSVDWAAASLTLEPRGTTGAKLLPDGSVLNAPGSLGESQEVSWRTAEGFAPTGLRLDVLRDDALPNRDPGPATPSRGFALTNLTLRVVRANAAPVTASAVRVELPGEGRILSLAEVELLAPDGEVIVEGLTHATQSSSAFDGAAGRAIDGRTSGVFGDGSVTHSATSADPWWQAEFVMAQPIAGLRLWPRTDAGHEARSHGLRVVLLGPDGDEVWRSAPAPAPAGDGEDVASSAGTTQVAYPAHAHLDVGPVVGEPLLLGSIGASYEESGFGIAESVDGLWSARTGWAVGSDEPRNQAAVFSIPHLEGDGAFYWTATLGQYRVGHQLGRWQLSMTEAAGSPLMLQTAQLTALRKRAQERTEQDARAVRIALETHDPDYLRIKEAQGHLASRLEAMAVVTTPVMEERPPSKRRPSHVLARGNFLQPEAQVHAAVPRVFPPLPEGVDPNRLTLARWLVSDVNPLTARVTVNRVWARLFGRGLVTTEGDFGSQGDVPSNRPLLDWLAVEFREGGWDHKDLLRTIVTSRTYQQSSTLLGRDLDVDPEGVWLSRFPRQRLEAEMVRDMALKVSGLLSSKRFGPSIFPPQPDGLWKAAFNSERSWIESTGEDRYRRGLYVFLRRSIPYPMLSTFDAPSRETCTVRRVPTNTPLQAFITLNDPVFVEASQALARRALTEAPPGMPVTVGQRGVLERMLWWAGGRPPVDDQVDLLESLYTDAFGAFATDPEGAEAFGAPMEFPRTGGVLRPTDMELAAWTLVASAVLNLDRTLTKE